MVTILLIVKSKMQKWPASHFFESLPVSLLFDLFIIYTALVNLGLS
jgi:hypothetical protein